MTVGVPKCACPAPSFMKDGLQSFLFILFESRAVRDDARPGFYPLKSQTDVFMLPLSAKMKQKVVEQIDRLTAGIDLAEETPCITQTSSHGSAHPGDLKLALQPNHKPASAPTPQHVDEDRIILRTNSPSPVHMASVVKTSRFTPPSLTKDINHQRPGVNGHPPHLCPPRDSNHVGQTYPEPHPHSLDPKVIIGNSTSNPRTQKPPLYPQNGRCGKGSYPPPKPVKTPSFPGGRGRQSASIV